MGFYYPGSKNKGADQLRSYNAADLRLCYRICKKPVFSQQGSYMPMLAILKKQQKKQQHKKGGTCKEALVYVQLVVDDVFLFCLNALSNTA